MRKRNRCACRNIRKVTFRRSTFYYLGPHLKTQYFSIPTPRRRLAACAMASDEGLGGRPMAWRHVSMFPLRGAEHASRMGRGSGGGRGGWRWRPASSAGLPRPRRDGGLRASRTDSVPPDSDSERPRPPPPPARLPSLARGTAAWRGRARPPATSLSRPETPARVRRDRSTSPLSTSKPLETPILQQWRPGGSSSRSPRGSSRRNRAARPAPVAGRRVAPSRRSGRSTSRRASGRRPVAGRRIWTSHGRAARVAVGLLPPPPPPPAAAPTPCPAPQAPPR